MSQSLIVCKKKTYTVFLELLRIWYNYGSKCFQFLQLTIRCWSWFQMHKATFRTHILKRKRCIIYMYCAWGFWILTTLRHAYSSKFLLFLYLNEVIVRDKDKRSTYSSVSKEERDFCLELSWSLSSPPLLLMPRRIKVGLCGRRGRAGDGPSLW